MRVSRKFYFDNWPIGRCNAISLLEGEKHRKVQEYEGI